MPINIKIYLLDIKNNAFFLVDIDVEQIIDEIIKFRKKKFDKKSETNSILVYESVPVTFRITVEYIYTVIVIFNVELFNFLYQRFFSSVTDYLFEINIYRQIEKTPVFIIIKTIFSFTRILILTDLL